MAATEDDIIRDEQERSSLLKAIADVETAMAAATPGARRILENTLENAKKRVAALDKKIEEAKVEHQAAEQTRMAAAAELAAKETRLSANERETYRGFLEKAYFTKKDFGKLDDFYAHSYDRLSEDGKEEMSKRIREGIKRGEFKASDLPESVLKRDSKISREHDTIGTLETIDRTSRADKQTHAQEGMNTARANDEVAMKPAHSSSNAKIDFGSVDLKGIKLVAAASEPTSASIPDASGQRSTQRS